MSGEGTSWPIQEIFEATLAVTLFLTLSGIILYAFDENTVETTYLGSEMSYVATIFPSDNAKISYQLNEETSISSSQNDILVSIDKAQTQREFFTPNSPSIKQEGNVLIITS